MSDAERLQRRYDELIIDFVHPLVRGRTVRVDQPHAPGAISYYEHASCTESVTDMEVFDALHRIASSIAPVPAVTWPDRDLLLLAMAAVNLVHVTDPALDRLFARGARRKTVDWVDEIVAAVAPPDTRADALARHALLDPLAALRREDITAKSWAYTYRFIGRPVGARLLSRPLFGGFPDQTRNLTDIGTVLAKLDAETSLGTLPRLRELLARSPITELLRLELCESFRFGLATLAVLSDDALRGGVAREIVERGEWKAAPRLGRALGDPPMRQAPPPHLYYALQLCFEVQMTATLDLPGPGLPGKLDLTDPDTARYAAVLPAYFEDETMIDEVRAFDDSDRGPVQERCSRIMAALPDGVMDEVTSLVRRCERPAFRIRTTNRPEARP